MFGDSHYDYFIKFRLRRTGKMMIRTKITSGKKGVAKFDSLVVEIPADFAVEHGLPARSLAALSFGKDGSVRSEVIAYDTNDEQFLEEFLSEFPNIDEEMTRIGD